MKESICSETNVCLWQIKKTTHKCCLQQNLRNWYLCTLLWVHVSWSSLCKHPILGHMTSLENIMLPSDRKHGCCKRKILLTFSLCLDRGGPRALRWHANLVQPCVVQMCENRRQLCSSLSFRNVTTFATDLFSMDNSYGTFCVCVHSALTQFWPREITASLNFHLLMGAFVPI